jgi:uncharacterized protein YegJ (DUF2314 family)
MGYKDLGGDTMNNIRLVCGSCIEDKRKEMQKEIDNKLKESETKEKLFIKKTFKDELGESEHMWVSVDKIDFESRTISGALDNDPVDLKNIKCGDKVVCSFDDIIEIINI